MNGNQEDSAGVAQEGRDEFSAAMAEFSRDSDAPSGQEAGGAKQEDYPYYVCPVCGYTAEKEAPERCPVCNASRPERRFASIQGRCQRPSLIMVRC